MNYKKTNSVLFSKTSKNESAELKITTNSGFIETSNVVKYLVFVFDKKIELGNVYAVLDENKIKAFESAALVHKLFEKLGVFRIW